MTRQWTRRKVLRCGLVAAAGSPAVGCLGAPRTGALLEEGFESGLDGWTTAASIGPEVPTSAFEWSIDRSQAEAADGEWSLEATTEGDHDDGTAWAVTTLSPGRASSFRTSVQAWSNSESFNTLRHLVAYLGPQRPADEGSFPDPGVNSTAVPDAPSGGLREPLNLAEGWREYAFEWRPESVPDTLYFAVGVSVVWESDATHYVDAVRVEAE